MITLLVNNHEVFLDDEDYTTYKKYSWSLVKGRNTRYIITTIEGKTESFHRLILGVKDDNKEVDHIDGNGLNNQKSNLRLATFSQNSFNRSKKHPKNTSGYRGVYKSYSRGRKFVGRYKAKIGNEYIGVFDSKEEAAVAFDKRARELYGEFSGLLNFKD